MMEFNKNADSEKIMAFISYLTPGSPADKWYESEGQQEVSWKSFMTKFKARFPAVEEAKKSTPDLEQEMEGLVLTMDNVGKTELFGGVQVETHKIHAKKILDLAWHAGINKSGGWMWKIWDKLPSIF